MKHRRFRVTDHAVIRYLERVQGIDVEAIRREISEVVAVAEAHPGASGVVLNGMRYKIRNGAVTTIMPARSRGQEGPWEP